MHTLLDPCLAKLVPSENFDDVHLFRTKMLALPVLPPALEEALASFAICWRLVVAEAWRILMMDE